MPASVSGGIDRIFPEPPHEIRGATRADQAWIDETIEAGKACCHWTIKPRPNGLDAAPPALAPAPSKKQRWWKRRKIPQA